MEGIDFNIALIHYILFSGIIGFVIMSVISFNKRLLVVLGTALALSQCLAACWVYGFIAQNGSLSSSVNWITFQSSTLSLGYWVTTEAALMLCVVTLVSTLVNLFSSVYMGKDPGIRRYYSYLSFFVFAMNGIVLADNLLMLFVFWELVGLASYLLIGFWFDKLPAAKASMKAFLMNKVGDVGFLLGILIVWSNWGTLDLEVLKSMDLDFNNAAVIAAGAMLIFGTIGKSAQMPLSAWLPDAMEGPTPVSALIHAATMVAAGIYLLGRIYFMLAPEVLVALAIIGAVTAITAALTATKQFDIKKVLAYSTISQLGYMVMGMGVGGYAQSIFHLTTHAFFKAGLFLAAGAIIHHLHHALEQQKEPVDPQDMRIMGGLKSKMPFTFVVFLTCTLALVGFPFTSGFLSKDSIIHQSVEWANSHGGWTFIIPIIGFAVVGITAFYMTRQLLLVFFGEPRHEEFSSTTKPKPSALSFSIPLGILAVGSLWFFYSMNPFSAEKSWLVRSFSDANYQYPPVSHLLTSGIALTLLAAGVVFGYTRFGKAEQGMQLDEATTWNNRLLRNNWFQDKILHSLVVGPILRLAGLTVAVEKKIIDAIVNAFGVMMVVLGKVSNIVDRLVVDMFVSLSAKTIGAGGQAFRSLQSGKVYLYITYAFLILITLTIILIY